MFDSKVEKIIVKDNNISGVKLDSEKVILKRRLINSLILERVSPILLILIKFKLLYSFL